jgi:hypothetical protein
MKLIQTITLTSTASSITFSSIPQTFTDLVVMSSVRTDFTGGPINDFGANIGGTQTFRRLDGNGSSASSSSGSGYVSVGITTTALTTANTFASNTAYIPNYASASAKSISFDGVSENNGSTAYQRMEAGMSTNTAPITSLDFGSGGPNFQIGTTVSLYGITKGSSGGVTVS